MTEKQLFRFVDFLSKEMKELEAEYRANPTENIKRRLNEKREWLASALVVLQENNLLDKYLMTR